jgi:hypothetical protein
VYILTCVISISAFLSGLLALRKGSNYKGNQFYFSRPLIYAALTISTTLSLVFCLLVLNSPPRTLFVENIGWWLYHTFDRLAMLAFHVYLMKKLGNWRKAIDIHGQDFRED